MKFGGTGVDSCLNLTNLSELVTKYKRDEGYEIVVVVSAVRGVTDSILNLTDSINKHDKVPIQDFLENLRSNHLRIIKECIHNWQSSRRSWVA
jgi:aspartate kinase